MNAELVKAMGVTLEITGTQLSDGAVRAILADLSAYPEGQVLLALKRCCREVKGRLTLADILARIDDGRLTPEEAWASIPKDELASIVWSVEMRDAYAAARTLINIGDLVAGRMTFLERYRVEVQRARDVRRPVEWLISLGHDKDGRELALLDAAEKGRISVDAVRGLLPYHRQDEGVSARLLSISNGAVKRLGATV